MSFLHPLFLLALTGLAVPIVLHLARRRTRHEHPFGSLRFLAASPPRFQSRRRLENWLLLALRCLALILLAGAFARPFFTRPLPGIPAATGRRILVLLDASASMRRGDLWSEALGKVKRQIDEAREGDRVALYAFDRRPRVLLRFDEWAETAPGARAGLVAARLAGAGPTWGGTDLGGALVAAAEALLDDEAAARNGPAVGEQVVVLVSDLQQGSRLLALHSSDWPRGVRLRVDAVAPAAGPNLGLAALAGAPGGAAGASGSGSGAPGPGVDKLKVRVVEGGGDPGRVQGTLRWETDASGAGGPPVAIDLAAGESRVVEIARRGNAPATLVLAGDAHAFDNRLAIAPGVAQAVEVLYLGQDDPKDPKGPLYFLERALPTTVTRAPRVTTHRPGEAGLAEAVPRAHLVVVTAEPGPGAVPALRAHLERGRTLLYLPPAGDRGATLAALAGLPALTLREAPAGREAVLTDLDFSHPVLAPFADGRFGDFTKIRFWKRRLLPTRGLPGARVLARFDDGAAAWLALPVGRGLLWIMTSGWHPSDSQLALSSKFVPLLWSLLETSAGLGSGQAQFFVGDPVLLPPAAGGGAGYEVRKPDGARVPVPPGSIAWTDTEEPGLYALMAQGQPTLPFAVNLPPAESLLAPLPLESLERLGIQLEEGAGGARAAGPSIASRPDSAAEDRRRQRTFFAELEGRQKNWRWVLAAVLLVLLAETVLAGRLRPRSGATSQGPSSLGPAEDIS